MERLMSIRKYVHQVKPIQENHIEPIDKIQNSAAYLESWVKTLKADKKILFKLLTQSNKAIKYLKGDIKK